MEYGYDHPELYLKDLIFAPAGKIPEEAKASRKGLDRFYEEHEFVELCRACGWNAEDELYSGYDPRIKILHARNNMGLWRIGRRWMIRDQPNNGNMGNDYMTQQFIRSQPSLDVPLLSEMRLLSEPGDQVHFTLMSQAQGEPLDLLWPSLTRAQRFNYAFQLGDAVKQLRQFHAPTAQKVNGDRLDDMVLAQCPGGHTATCKKIGATDKEWFDTIAAELRHGLAKIHRTRDRKVIDDELRKLQDNFPSSEPYVLTHADLNLSNVIVKDDKIEAILDWEMAGYHPWWVEYQRMGMLWPVNGGDGLDDEIFDAVWNRVEPGVDHRALFNEFWPKFMSVRQAWQACETDHPDSFTAWVRPRFCECKPFAGRFRWPDLGKPSGHRIRDLDPTLAAPDPCGDQASSDMPTI